MFGAAMKRPAAAAAKSPALVALKPAKPAKPAVKKRPAAAKKRPAAEARTGVVAGSIGSLNRKPRKIFLAQATFSEQSLPMTNF